MEDLQNGRAISRRHRNRRIGEFLKELDLVEGPVYWYPQDPASNERKRFNGSPAPLFGSDDDRTWFLTRLPVHDQAHGSPTGQVTGHDTGQVTGHDTGQVTQQVTPQDTGQDTPQDDRHVPDHVEQLVAALNEEMSRAQLQEVLRLKDRNHFTNKYLRRSLEAAVIEMVIPEKATSANQRYRRTAAGAGPGATRQGPSLTPPSKIRSKIPSKTPLKYPTSHRARSATSNLVAVLTGAMSGARLQERLRLRDRNHFTAAYPTGPRSRSGRDDAPRQTNKPTSRNKRYRRTTAGEPVAQRTRAQDASP